MSLSPEQRDIASVLGYAPCTETEQLEPCSVELCSRSTEIRDGWPWVMWSGQWYPAPTMGEVEQWTFDSICPTPDDEDVEPDHPDSWLRILGIC